MKIGAGYDIHLNDGRVVRNCELNQDISGNFFFLHYGKKSIKYYSVVDVKWCELTASKFRI